MPLLYSAIVPHSPLLVPTIGKEHHEALSATIRGLEDVAAHLRSHEIDTIVMIAPESEASTQGEETTFYIHAPEQYEADFIEFGDLATKVICTPDHFLADQIKQDLLKKHLTIQYQSKKKLEYDAAVPLLYLTKGLSAKVIVIHPTGDDGKQHALFGRELQKTLQESSRRIALIASGELSHRLTADSPLGYWKDALSFDQQCIKILKERRHRKLLNIKDLVLHEAQTCGIPSFIILLSALEHMECDSHLISYEGPLGIGHLVMEYVL